MSVGLRLRELREYKGLSVALFAKKLGEKDYKIRDSESEKQKIASDLLENIGISYNVNLNWLLTGNGTMFNSEKVTTVEDTEDDEILDVPVFLRKQMDDEDTEESKIEIPFYPDTYAAAGYGADNDYTTDAGVMSFDQDFLRMQLGISSFSGLHIITAVGDSMIKTFSSGELLFVLPFQSEDNVIRDDAIYVFQTPNGTMVKRIEVHPIKKYYILHSDNDKVEPIKVEGDEIDSCVIVGRVVAHFDRV